MGYIRGSEHLEPLYHVVHPWSLAFSVMGIDYCGSYARWPDCMGFIMAATRQTLGKMEVVNVICCVAGQEGFAANSTPLYMYSNPGAWASLLGVDFVRNNKAKGIDYATMHVYVDQWLCVAEGSTTQGQLDFMKCVLPPALCLNRSEVLLLKVSWKVTVTCLS